MRIIAGELKGASIRMPNDKNTRPLKDLVRESIFNILKHSNKLTFNIENSQILDLYAGSGSFGLECLSRKAKNVCFVEKYKHAVEVLEKNIQKLKVKKKTQVFFSDIFKLQKNNFNLQFDLIFCDPPFKERKTKELIDFFIKEHLLTNNSIIIFHREKNVEDNMHDNFKIIEEKIYGLSKVIFGKCLV